MHKFLVVTSSAPRAIPTMGFIISEQFRKAGVEVGLVGRGSSGLLRLLNVFVFGFLKIPRYKVTLIDVYGSRAFVYESAAILYARLLRKRVVVMMHSGYMPEFVERWPRFSRMIMSLPDLVLVPHMFLYERLRALGMRVDSVIPNFINLERYIFRQRSHLVPKFLYLRGMHPITNAPMVLETFALIQRVYPDASLTMAGRWGTDADRCRELVSTLNLKNVRFVGIVPKEDIPRLADEHDIYLQTNRVDNMPVSVIEMWACGLPTVATNVGGVPYMIRDGQDGLLVKSENPEGMAEACLKLLNDDQLAARLSFNGRARAEELSWERIRPDWEDALYGSEVKRANAAQVPQVSQSPELEKLQVNGSGTKV
jgi:L-malate glycosyltransferase